MRRFWAKASLYVVFFFSDSVIALSAFSQLQAGVVTSLNAIAYDEHYH